MYEKIKEYTEQVVSFHMPGHKGGLIRTMDDLFRADVTEVDGMDDLHHATGIIEEVNHHIERLYGSGYSTMLVNGSTGGLLSAISGTVSRGGHAIIARNCHKAVYNSVILNRLKVHIVVPDYLDSFGFFGAVTADRIKQVFKESKDPIEAVILTSPTYEGIVSDIESIADIVHQYGAILIVDEAHGAHFVYSNALPCSAVACGADIVIQSAHKTLPCMTQSALLHISQEALDTGRVDLDSVQRKLAVFQTSSPSYVLMSSIETGINYMDSHRVEFETYIRQLQAYITKYRNPYGNWLINLKPDIQDRHDKHDKHNKHNKDDKHDRHGDGADTHLQSYLDVTRLTFVITDHRMTGWELNKQIRERYQIQVELAGYKHLVAISTLADQFESIIRLGQAIYEILNDSATEHQEVFLSEQSRLLQLREVYNHSTKISLDISAADERPGIKCKLKEAYGKISNRMIIPYPPGIPLIVPGETFTQEKISYIEYLLENDMEVYGIIKGDVTILE